MSRSSAPGLRAKRGSSMLACSFYGSTATIKAKLAPLIEATDADELMVAAAI